MSYPSASCLKEVSVQSTGKPSVTFVIPVFNDEKNVARCLRSLRNLRFPEQEYEVLIVDNGSTDRTHHIMREMGFPFTVIDKVHVSALRNHGAMMAQGDFLAFVDSDVELSTQWLENSLEVFKDQTVVAAGCFPGIPEEATWVQCTWDIHQRGRQKPGAPVPVAWLPSMNLVVRRDVFKAVSGFNERLETAEDVDLCYRLERLGTILCTPGMEAKHWGEAHDLPTFWRKEVWRGTGNLRGVFSHGFRWAELPSLAYPLYTLILVMAFLLGCFVEFGQGQLLFSPLSLGLLCLPALLLAISTARLARRPAAFPSLFLLYLIYGLARAYSVIRASLPRGEVKRR
ncbi:MAG: glycosyltransferase [Nitrospirae bacterium]|nr:glycosyltransferase [Nitrospirota bacterium]